MQIKKYLKKICLLITIIIFLYDVCPKKIQMDSFFMCKNGSSLSAPTEINVSPSLLLFDQAKQQEISSFHKVSHRTNYAKITRTLFQCHSFGNEASRCYQTIQILQDVKLQKDISKHMVLMNYIHFTDGKKPQLI